MKSKINSKLPEREIIKSEILRTRCQDKTHF